MRYETPELVVLASAIDAIQVGKFGGPLDAEPEDAISVYEDWEE
jgi:hypothetical protein